MSMPRLSGSDPQVLSRGFSSMVGELFNAQHSKGKPRSLDLLGIANHPTKYGIQFSLKSIFGEAAGVEAFPKAAG